MANVLPPYLNKMVDKCEKEVANAEKKELRAKKDYEYSIEYTRLCKERLAKAKEQAKE